MSKNMQVVSGIIERGDGQILIAQRPPGKLLAGFWEFPGGKIEANESAHHALIRELREELELEIEMKQFLGIFPYAYEWGAIDLHVFVVRALSAPATTDSVHTFRWILPQDIHLDQLAAADLEPLRTYSSYLGPKSR